MLWVNWTKKSLEMQILRKSSFYRHVMAKFVTINAYTKEIAT